jgi:hypothetical protein
MWIAALVFTTTLIAFMITTFFLTPTFTVDQRRTVLFLFPLLAGFSTFFVGGSALIEVTGEIATGTKISFSATAGIAVFVLCYLYPPYFFKIPQVQEAVAATRRILLEQPEYTRGDETNRRKTLAEKLYKNCTRWSQVLIEVFDEAGRSWARQGLDSARDIIIQQQKDIDKLDYWSLRAANPILLFLKKDSRFVAFADACGAFYVSALDVKARAYGSIRELNNEQIEMEVARWGDEVEAILRPVADEFHKLQTEVG